MKSLLSEEQLRKLIKEDLGVSRAAISYSNLILNKITPVVTFFASLKRGFTKDIVIDLKDIASIYQSSVDDFIDLPIEKINIKLVCKKIKGENSKVPFATGGAAYPIEKKYKKSSYLTNPSLLLPKYILEEVSQTIVVKLELNVYTTNLFNNTLNDELLYDLRDSIVHEMNHVLEYYKRIESGAPTINTSLSWTGQKNYNLPKNIFDFWKYFLDLVYYSEPYEVNARSQEAYSQIIRTPFEEYKKSNMWKLTETMKNFNSENYYNELVDKLEKWRPNISTSATESLFEWFMDDYEKQMKVYKQELPRFISRTTELKNLIKKFQPIINNAGEKLQRNIMRLYTLEQES